MGDQPTNPTPEDSVILIRFASPNSALMEIKYMNVSPVQAVAAAWLLEQEAERTLQAQVDSRKQQEQLRQIAVPSSVGRGT